MGEGVVEAGMASVAEAAGRGTVALFVKSAEWLTCLGPHAELVADKYFGSRAFFRLRSTADGRPIGALDLKRRELARLLRKLVLELQCRVELYEKLGSKWEASAKGSPGNFAALEDLMGEEVEGLKLELGPSSVGDGRRGVLAVEPKKDGWVCAAWLREDELRLSLGRWQDDAALGQLKALVAQLRPAELLLPEAKDSERHDLVDLLARNLVFVAQIPAEQFALKGVEDMLDGLLKFPSAQISKTAQLAVVAETPGCLGPAGAAVRYLQLQAKPQLKKRLKVEHIPPPDASLRLLPFVVKALELFPGPKAVRGGPPTSLFALLNRCQSPLGSRILEQWMRLPSRQAHVVEERLDCVEALSLSSAARYRLRGKVLGRVPDLLAVQRRFLRGKASLQDCVRLHQVLSLLPEAQKALVSLEEEVEERLRGSIRSLLREPLEAVEKATAKLSQLVETTVDLAAVGRERVYRIRQSFDPNLEKTGGEMRECEADLEREARKVAGLLGLDLGKTVKLEVSGPQGPCLKVTMKEEKALRGAAGIQRLDTVKAGVRFTTKALAAEARRHDALREVYEETSKEIVAEVLRLAGGYLEPLAKLQEALGVVDAVGALAEAACSAQPPWVRPRLVGDSEPCRLRLKALRHPVVEAADDASFIPNDAELCADTASLTLITGPNMGGKSTFMRSVGLAAVMAQMGSLVAAEEAEVSLLDGVFTRVGASDDEVRGISTFMAEMLETAGVLEAATERSLVLVDELGRGTSTEDGLGLAWAVAEDLLRTRTLTLFATHLHPLTALPDSHPHARNLHVSSRCVDGALTLLFQLQAGPADQSFGLNVLRSLAFPADVVAEAQAFMDEAGPEKDAKDRLRQLLKDDDLHAARQLLKEIA